MGTDNQNNPSEIDAHGKYTQAYVDILNTYKNQISNSVTKKNELKTKFFWLISIIMTLLTALFIISILWSFMVFNLMIKNDYESVSVIVGAVTGMITTLSTMILSIFKLPKIIANYLFNKKEDNQMIEIIKNIQAYELQAVKLEKLEIMKQVARIENAESEDSPLTESLNVDGVQPVSASDITGESSENNTIEQTSC